MDKITLKQVINDNQQDVERYVVEERDATLDDFPCKVLVGVRRAGKSYLLYHRIQQLLKEGHRWDEMLYLSFEDERLDDFQSEDFNKLLECHQEMYGKRPMLFLDEIQNIPNWEKFARRMADTGYNIYITGSNAKMLSGEVNTTLGGRFLTEEVYPYSFKEYLQVLNVSFDEQSILSTVGKSEVVRRWNEYLHDGGLPASVHLPAKRNYLSSVYQKIYLGDIIARNKITNLLGMKVMVKKMAESVCRPISYNRLNNIASSVGGKQSLLSTIKYVNACEEAWLLLRLKNFAACISEKESNCKFYFIDNGILGLFLIDKDTILLENAVALHLFRKYGHDLENERVYFYQDGYEVDFYIPEDETAIQVCYSLQDQETRERELQALTKISKRVECKRRIVVTFDEEGAFEDSKGKIDIIAGWRFLLN